MTDAQQAQAIADQRARSRRLKAEAPASPMLDMGYTDEELEFLSLLEKMEQRRDYSQYMDENLNRKAEWN